MSSSALQCMLARTILCTACDDNVCLIVFAIHSEELSTELERIKAEEHHIGHTLDDDGSHCSDPSDDSRSTVRLSDFHALERDEGL